MRWCSTRPPVAIPLDEMTIAGCFDAVSCFESAVELMVRKRSVAKVAT